VKWAYRPIPILAIRLRLKGEVEQREVPRWNFVFSRPRKCAQAKKFSHAKTFGVGLLASWTKVPWHKPLVSLSAFEGFFSQRQQDFRVSEILPPLNDNFPVLKYLAHSSRALNKLDQVADS